MTARIPAEVFPPGEFVREELEARGWTQTDFATILGRPLRLVNQIISGKSSVTPETAKGLAEAFGTSAELWLNLDSVYQLSRVKSRSESVARRARLYEKAPVREMIKRHWIESSDSIDVLEERVKEFFGLPAIEQEAQFWPFAARTSLSYAKPTPSQSAWLFRARKLAHAVQADRFTDAKLDEGIEALKLLLLSPEEIRKVPQIMASAGVRLVILESFPNTRIDGACFWLNPSSPVVVLSLRHDRIDGFWHTLFHELGHVKKRHGLTSHEPIDTNLVGNDAQAFNERPAIEQEVDYFATAILLARGELDGFISRVKPLYSKFKILNFAHRVRVHPGIVVGQLQFRKEIPYSRNRDLLVRVRGIITKTALTDGWGTVPVGI